MIILRFLRNKRKFVFLLHTTCTQAEYKENDKKQSSHLYILRLCVLPCHYPPPANLIMGKKRSLSHHYSEENEISKRNILSISSLREMSRSMCTLHKMKIFCTDSILFSFARVKKILQPFSITMSRIMFCFFSFSPFHLVFW